MPIPNAPSDLVVTANGGYSSASLEWADNSSDETGFKIERSPDNDDWAQIDTVGANITYYRNTGLTAGSPYFYRVRAYNGSGDSGYTASDQATIFQLSDVGTPFLDLDGDEGAYNDAGITLATDGQTVQEWHDQSGSGYHVTQTTEANKPTFQTNEVNGHDVIRFSATDILVAALASDWKLLHDGSAHTVFIVWQTSVANPDDLYILYDTGAIVITDTGQSVRLDDRSGSSRNMEMSITITRGSAPVEAQAVTQAFAVAPDTDFHIYSHHRASAGILYMNNDGHWGGNGSGAVNGSPDTGNPTAPLTVGGSTTNTYNLVGDIARILIYDSDLSEADYQNVVQFLGEKYGRKEMQFYGSSSVIVQGYGEPTYDFMVGGGLTIAENGNLVAIYFRATSSSLSTFQTSYAIISSDGGDTWGSPIEIFDKTTDGGGTDWYGPGNLLTLPNGDIILSAAKIVNGALVDDGNAYFRSIDNGQSWTGPTDLTGSGTDYDIREGNSLLQLANGDILFPYRYRNIGGGSTWTVAVLMSDDNGDTWSELSDIDTGTEYASPSFYQEPGGDVVCLFRDNNLQEIRKAVSVDNGETWGASSSVFFGWGNPDTHYMSDGLIYGNCRQSPTYESNPDLCTFISQDDGVNFQFGYEHELSPNYVDGYYQLTSHAFIAANGTIYLLTSCETETNVSSDVMFTKAVRFSPEEVVHHPLPLFFRP